MDIRLIILALVIIACYAGEAFAKASPADGDDEYEEVVIRRKKRPSPKVEKTEKKTEIREPQVQGAVVAPTVIVPAVVVPVAVPVAAPAPTPVVSTEEEKDEEPPPPPDPPTADAADARRLVRYFCKCWKDQDWERLWRSMSESYRKKVSLKKFKKLFVEDAETNGGLQDENILQTSETEKGNKGVKVELIFKFPKAQHRIVMAEVEKQSGGQYRIVSSPIIPLDMDDL